MIGRTISHYEITEKLGEGGMAVVYKARDSRLKRFVALKVLPPEKVADEERKQRFVQEARAASALNHPNIATVHDIDQSDGVDFIAMEYVAGNRGREHQLCMRLRERTGREIMFRVITVAREYGSGGGAIAQAVAERLGWQLLDRNLIAAVARTAQVDVETARRYDESVGSWWHRINRGGLWSAAIEAGVTPVDAQFFDAETMAALAQEMIAGAAAKGQCVIVGRGAQCVLQSCAGAFHVFVYAPWAERVARVQKRVGTNGDTGELLRSTDRTRATYVRRYFGCDWKDPHLYHMMISSQLGDEHVARLIVGAVERPELAALSRSSGL